MKDSKLIQIISSFSKTELNRLEKLVVSPFFNKNQQVIDFFYHIKQFYPLFDSPEIDKKTIYKTLYPKDTYNDARIRNIISDLTKLVEQFIIWQEVDEEPLGKTQYLLKAAKQRDMSKYHEPSLKQWARLQKQNPHRDVLFYFNQHQLMEEQYEYTAKKSNRASERSLQRLTDNLDIYYLSKKLKYCCEMINRANVFSEAYEMKLFEEVMEHIKQNKYEDVPVIRVYYQILLTLLESDNEAHYFELKALLEQHSGLFPQEDNKTNYSFAQNYCIKKINSGRADYLKEIFSLYKLSLENEVIYDSGLLSQWDYKNITTVGLRLNETEWTEYFINNYKDRIDRRHRENAYKYNLANLHFYKDEFGKTMQLLLQVDFTDIYYNLDSKSLLLKAYYELNEYEALFAHADAFNNYLRRNDKISAYQKKVYKNLVKYAIKLAKLRLARHSIPEKLADEINTAQIADATWLRKKIEEPAGKKLINNTK